MSEKHETRIRRFLDLKDKTDELTGHIEKIVRVDNFDRKRAAMAKAKINAAIQILNQEVDVTKRVSDKDLGSIMNKLQDMARRGRQYLMIMRLEDGSGIIDLSDGHEYLFEKRD